MRHTPSSVRPDRLSLAGVSLHAARPLASLRCLDVRSEHGEPRALGPGVVGTPCDEPRASLRWDHDAASSLLPALSVHERARLIVRLDEGVSLSLVPGRAERVDPSGRTLLLTLDGHAGVGALRFTEGDRAHAFAIRVRARWDESPEALLAMAEEVRDARWSAAAREDRRALTVPSALRDGAPRDESEECFALWSIARSRALADALRDVKRAPATALVAAVRAVHPHDPRAADDLAARGVSGGASRRGERDARARGPVSTRDTRENRMLRGFLDGLVGRAQRLGAQGAPLLAVFDGWRGELPWLAEVRARGEPAGGFRQARYEVIARHAALVERASPTLREGALPGAISLWSTASLYERWCAIELAGALGLSPFEATRLIDGAAVGAEWPGGALRVAPQKRIETALPIAFRPDFTLSHRGRCVVLDAKYRLDPGDPDGGFVRDELVKMHAYRDAVAGCVGAYALFPGAEGALLDGSDARGGVGAIPFRPSGDESVRRAQRASLRARIEALLG